MTFLRRTTSVLTAGIVIGLVAGTALGVVWWQLAPRVSMVVRPDTAFPANYQPDGYIAADVSFATLACLAGVAVTIGLMNMRREHLLSSLWAALISGAIGSALMWTVGSRLGSVDIAGLSATIDDNVVVDAPLEIMMPAILLIWSATAALVVTVVAFSDWLQEVRASQREQ